MTLILSIDPGKNSGASLGFYDPLTPYQLLDRWQIHGGVDGFLRWHERDDIPQFDELFVEKFKLDEDNDFAADLTPVQLEGVIMTLNMHYWGKPLTWMPRTLKGSLTGYPPEAVTKAQRQRVRFDFLERFGLFVPGTENDDSNDTIVQSLVGLKLRRHYPTVLKFWPPRQH